MPDGTMRLRRACELDSPDAIRAHMAAPVTIGGLTHFWHFAFSHDTRPFGTLLLDETKRIPASDRRQDIAVGLHGPGDEATRRRFPRERRFMPAAGENGGDTQDAKIYPTPRY